MRQRAAAFLLILTLLFTLSGCGKTDQGTDYARTESWAYLETDGTGSADVFFICPTVYGGKDNLSLDNRDTLKSFLGATNMEKGIYEDAGRFFAPYYRQAGLSVYELPAKEREPYFSVAYADVRAAFSYYLEHYNDGRPVVLAGFSQGGRI